MSEEHDPLLGAQLDGKYRLLSRLGAGGMGKVYRAEQMALGRQIAVKVLDASDSHRDADPAVERRFFLEASLCAKLSHPNVVVVHDYGRVEIDGVSRFFIAMELLEGDTLHRRLGKGGTVLSASDTLTLGIEIARGLRAAHKAGMVHRDLKPGNIMLVPADDGERVKILDFGLVKQVDTELREDITQEGTFLGSPRYMAPEQVSALPVDHRCDLYSLGIILYQCLTGKTPFDGKSPMDVLVQHVSAPVPRMADRNPDVKVSPVVESVVRKLLEKSASNRYADAEALLAALRDAQADLLGDPTLASKSGSGAFVMTPIGSQLEPTVTAPAMIASSEPSGTIAGATVRAPPYVKTQPAPKRSPWLIAGGVGVLLVGVVAVGFKVRSTASAAESGRTGTQSTQAGPAPQGATTNAATVAANQSGPVVLHITSSPAAARVRENGVVLGVTPLDVALSPNGPARSFEVLQEGFVAYRFTQAPTSVAVNMHAELLPDPTTPTAVSATVTAPVVRRVQTSRHTTNHGARVGTSPAETNAVPNAPGESIRMTR